MSWPEFVAPAARASLKAELLVVVGLVAVVIGALTVPQSAAAAGDVGYRGLSFGPPQAPGGNPDDGPTGEKPQNKLWYNAGTWWAVMFNRTAGQYRIYRLSVATQSWSDTGSVIDARRYSHADALWDGTHLYVATAGQPGKGNTDRSARVLRFTYNAATQSFVLDAGFPVVVANVLMEAIGLDKDTTGTVWVTFTYDSGAGGRKVYLTHTLANDTTWTVPFVLPAAGADNLSADDISAIVAFSGQIGVMWSNQNASTLYFAAHADGTPDNAWSLNPALQGPGYADDHIDLKSLQADSAGRVFAAVKTSLNDINPNPSAPLTLLLILDLQGSWQRRTFGTVGDNHTRPIVMIDEEHRQLYMFATSNTGNVPSAIYYKQTSLDNINFPAGLGTPFMASDVDRNINNATSTRQNVNSQTGLVVLASDLTTGNYWHNYLPLNALATGTPTATGAASSTPTPSGATNLALNHPAVASSLESGSYPAGAAVDGNATTRWSSQFADPQWIYVDLGDVYALNRVILSWESAYGRAYEIQVSNDAVNWSTAYSTTTGDGGTDDLAINATGRYVRMYGTARATAYGYSLFEFEVYGSGAVPPTSTPLPTATATGLPATATATATTVPPTATATATALPPTVTPTALPPTATATATATAVPSTATATATAAPPTATFTPVPPTATPGAVNLALNRPAVASSVESANYPPAAAFDGSLSTRWSSQFADPQWIYVDLGQGYALNRVILKWESAYGRAYEIQVSDDAVNWTSVFSTTTGNGWTDDLAVSGTGRYVRMYGTVRATVYGYSLFEFQVYGTNLGGLQVGDLRDNLAAEHLEGR